MVQSGIRLMRCMFDLTMQKGQALNCETMLHWLKLLENRMTDFDSPLRQFCKSSFTGYNAMKNRREDRGGFLSDDLYERLTGQREEQLPLSELLEWTPEEIAAMLRCNRGSAQNILHFCRMIPRFDTEYRVKPVAQTILKVDIELTPQFEYNRRWHLVR